MPRSTTNPLVDAIDLAEEELRQAKYYYLKQTGWERSTAFPGAPWFYIKRVGDFTYAMEEAGALLMQRNMDGC